MSAYSLGQRISLCPPPPTPRLRRSVRGFSARGLPGGAAAPPSAAPRGALGCGSSLTPLGEAPATAFLTLSFLMRSCSGLSGRNRPPPEWVYLRHRCGRRTAVTLGLWAAAVLVWVLSSPHFYLGPLQREVSLLPRERLSGNWVPGPFCPRPARLLLRNVGGCRACSQAPSQSQEMGVCAHAHTHTHVHTRSGPEPLPTLPHGVPPPLD